jgi:hypothetical protein
MGAAQGAADLRSRVVGAYPEIATPLYACHPEAKPKDLRLRFRPQQFGVL